MYWFDIDEHIWTYWLDIFSFEQIWIKNQWVVPLRFTNCLWTWWDQFVDSRNYTNFTSWTSIDSIGQQTSANQVPLCCSLYSIHLPVPSPWWSSKFIIDSQIDQGQDTLGSLGPNWLGCPHSNCRVEGPRFGWRSSVKSGCQIDWSTNGE